MKELEALSNQILKRAKDEGQRKVVEKEREVSEKIEESRQRLVEQQKSRKAAIKSRSVNELERQEQSLANEKRNRILAQKQTVMTAVYEEAVEKMAAWDTKTFQTFTRNVLSHFSSPSLQLIPGEKTAEHFTADFVEDLKKNNPGLQLSSSTVPNKAGFIVEEGGIDYNFFFDQMIAEIKKDFSPKLASLAFQNK